jgi:serine protease DegS
MRIRRAIWFLFQFITLGLAVAFVVLYLLPGKQQEPAPVVEIHEATETAIKTDTDRPGSFADAVEATAPAVVNISTRTVVTEERHPFFSEPFFQEFFGDQFAVPRQRLQSSLGSGVIISPQGYVITNNHVVASADEIEIALRDGRTTAAEVVGTDPETDLAVLRIELRDVPAITLGRSETLRVGDIVLAIGNPFGVGQTVTSGIVSATGRNMLGINTFENFIQTDAAINPGNSGGALITTDGRLIGINSAIFSRSGGSQGIGFAIPVDLAKEVMTQIIQHGQVVRGWLGVAIQDLTPQLAESFELQSSDGVVISNVVRNGPADKAGLDRGDVITHVDGQAVATVRHALDLISQVKPGDTTNVGIVRQGKKLDVKATVAQRPKEQ